VHARAVDRRVDRMSRADGARGSKLCRPAIHDRVHHGFCAGPSVVGRSDTRANAVIRHSHRNRRAGSGDPRDQQTAFTAVSISGRCKPLSLAFTICSPVILFPIRNRLTAGHRTESRFNDRHDLTAIRSGSRPWAQSAGFARIKPINSRPPHLACELTALVQSTADQCVLKAVNGCNASLLPNVCHSRITPRPFKEFL